MLKIAVADDVKYDLNQIKDILETYQNERHLRFDIQYFDNGRNLWFEVDDGKRFDVYLMDIEMPEMNGIETAKLLRTCDQNSYLVFITSHLGYAPDASEYLIFRYIEKLSLKKRLPQALDAILKDREKKHQQNEYYYVVNKSGQERVHYHDIIYLYKDGKNAIFVKQDGKESKVRKSLEQVYDELEFSSFVYIEKGYIVNLRHVEKVEGNTVYLSNDITLPVGRLRIKELKTRLREFWGMTT